MQCAMFPTCINDQTMPSYGFGRYGFAFFGPRIAFRATDALWGRATPFFYHFSVHLSCVLGRTELCHEVWIPGPQKPQIISNENHHLALLEMIRGPRMGGWICCGWISRFWGAPRRIQPPMLSALIIDTAKIQGEGSIRLRFARGTVRAVPAFGSDGSSGERVFCAS